MPATVTPHLDERQYTFEQSMDGRKWQRFTRTTAFQGELPRWMEQQAARGWQHFRVIITETYRSDTFSSGNIPKEIRSL